MKDKLQIENGALDGEHVINGQDQHGKINATLSLFLKAKKHNALCASNGRTETQRLASLIMRKAEAESWAGKAGTISWMLENWAIAVLERLARNN